MRRRRGWTLMEMLAVMTCGTTLVVAGVSLVHVMLDLQTSGQAHWRRRSALAQLAEQFREDVHSAVAAGPAGAASKTTWEWNVGGESSVRYVVEGDHLTRTAVEQGRTVGRQSFALPDDTAATLEFASDPAGPVASLVIRPATAAENAPKSVVPVPPVRIDAAWALDRRLARTPAGGR